jgi:hypothetical protein
MKQELIDHLIKHKFDTSSIITAVLIANNNGNNAPYVKAYLEKYPLWNKGLDELILHNIAFVYPGEPVTILNARLKEEFTETKSTLFEMAEELWDAYPGALPLSGGGMFISRKGTDKHEVLKTYLERINNSEEKHKFVLEQLKVYVKLVIDSKINGHRIHDWISNEMWDIIPSLSAGARGEFKTDI